MKYAITESPACERFPSKKSFTYNNELDDISAITGDISNVLQDSGYTFQLSLNGKKIPVHLWGDLGFFLDDFVGYGSFLFGEAREDFTLGMHEQGIETNIHFSYVGEGIVRIEEDKWLAGRYERDLLPLQRGYTAFAEQLHRIVGEMLPNLVRHLWYIRWRSQIQSHYNELL